MRGVTHAVAGLAAGVAMSEIPGVEVDTAWIPIMATLGGLLPDIDEPRSTVSHLPGKGRKVGRSLVQEFVGKKGLLPGILEFLVRLVTGAMEMVTVGIATFIRAVLGHRGAVHSLSMGFLVTAVVTAGIVVGIPALNAQWETVSLDVPWIAGPALGVGYLAHLLTDMLTKGGVPLWWPISKKRVRLLPRTLAFRTGGIFDWMTMLSCVFVILWMTGTLSF